MGDLRNNPVRMNELATWVMHREGYFQYFYNDNENYVTIGFGTLVKTEDDARKIARDVAVRFTFLKEPHRRATVEEVAADWRRVHQRPNLHERAYADVAMLRLDVNSVKHLMMQEISKSASSLYRYHPFLVHHDSRIAMAFVDTRYNPAGVNPYLSGPTKPLWEALDPRSKTYDPEKAYQMFDHIWGNRGGKNKVRYHQRHLQRLHWFRQGLDAMGPGGRMCIAS